MVGGRGKARIVSVESPGRGFRTLQVGAGPIVETSAEVEEAELVEALAVAVALRLALPLLVLPRAGSDLVPVPAQA